MKSIREIMEQHMDRDYEGFSLVEMLITIVIIGVVMLISATTLTTLIKVSTVSSSKTLVRNETEFVLEMVRRTIRNSNPSDVYLFDTYEHRRYDPENNIVRPTIEGTEMEPYYAYPLGENVPGGNEIHFRPYGFTSWVCVGFFPSIEDEAFGYILKTSAQNLWGQHHTCFDNTDDYSKYTIVLNSDSVDIDGFDISYVTSADGNYVFKFDIAAQPTEWYLGPGAPVNREVFRQAVVTTGGLIW